MAAGPTSTTKIPGKMNSTSGKISCTAVFAAFSSAICLRRVRIESDWTRRAWAMLDPNRSAWIQFTTVKNERWHHENVVLMGDAAHTAHFSVGSGTKMAMEDSMALAGALVKHARMEDALAAYEAERRPEVERIQTAAAQSRDWFERTRTHVRHPTERLVFSLDLREGRPLTLVPSLRKSPLELVADAASLGIRRMIVLDLDAVGRNEGPRVVELCREIRRARSHLELVAGGGVRGARDLDQLRAAGVDAALVSSWLHSSMPGAPIPSASP